jgi:hypothetical protein
VSELDVGETDAQRHCPHDLGVTGEHGGLDELHLLSRADGAGVYLDRLHRHRPQQLDRHAYDPRGRADFVLLDDLRE